MTYAQTENGKGKGGNGREVGGGGWEGKRGEEIGLETLVCRWDELGQLSSVPQQTGSSEGPDGRFSRDPLPVFSAGGPCEQFWHGHGCPLFDVVHPAFPLPISVRPLCSDTYTQTSKVSAAEFPM